MQLTLLVIPVQDHKQHTHCIQGGYHCALRKPSDHKVLLYHLSKQSVLIHQSSFDPAPSPQTSCLSRTWYPILTNFQYFNQGFEANCVNTHTHTHTHNGLEPTYIYLRWTLQLINLISQRSNCEDQEPFWPVYCSEPISSSFCCSIRTNYCPAKL